MLRNRIKFFALTSVVVAALAAPAVAGGSIKDGPYPAARPLIWTGLYVGAHVGGGRSDVDWRFIDLATQADHSGSGAFGGVQAGYNWQTGSIVYGIEGDVSRHRNRRHHRLPERRVQLQS